MPNPDWLRYSNSGATRNWPLNPRLVNALSFLGDMGVTMDVFSGGQPSSGPHRTGSHRHDNGNAGDVMFSRGGHTLSWANAQDRPTFEQIVQRARAAGVTGFGAGDGYMRPGSMHIGFGTPAVWGAGGSGANAPGWLSAAFGGGAGGSAGGGAGGSTMDMARAAPPDTLSAAFGKAAGANVGKALGDVLASPPQDVQSALMPPTSMGNLGYNFLQQAEERRQREEEQRQQEEQQRRTALFAPPVVAAPPGLAGLYG